MDYSGDTLLPGWITPGDTLLPGWITEEDTLLPCCISMGVTSYSTWVDNWGDSSRPCGLLGRYIATLMDHRGGYSATWVVHRGEYIAYLIDHKVGYLAAWIDHYGEYLAS